MECYLINIFDFSIIEKSQEHKFINELYPGVSDKYRMLWFIENMSYLTTTNKEKLMTQIENNIDVWLDILSLPKDILLIKAGKRYMEPLSKKLFKIKNEEYLKCISERTANEYLKNNKNNNNFIEAVTRFKRITLTDDYQYQPQV